MAHKVHQEDGESRRKGREERHANIIFYWHRAILGRDIIVALAAIISDIRRLRHVEIITWTA